MSDNSVVQKSLLSRRHFMQLAAGSCLIGAVTLATGCTPKEEPRTQAQASWLESDPQKATIFAFDTAVSLTAYCSEDLMQQAVDRCSYFEKHFSRTIEGSDVWNINNAAGSPVEVAEETADLITKSLDYCVKSDGLFDITIGSVSSLWDFKLGVKPSDEQIQEAITHVDYSGVKIEGTTVTLSDPDAMIDLGGAAKGYIADELAKVFKEGGCVSAIINLGGNAFALGKKPDGSDWRVGIQDPNAITGSSVIASIDCSDASVVTSGLYERQFEQAGQMYYHILDPRTGYPVVTDLVSSSVIGSSSLDCDAYATWMFLLGHKGALELLEASEGLEGMIVDQNDEITMTKNAKFNLR